MLPGRQEGHLADVAVIHELADYGQPMESPNAVMDAFCQQQLPSFGWNPCMTLTPSGGRSEPIVSMISLKSRASWRHSSRHPAEGVEPQNADLRNVESFRQVQHRLNVVPVPPVQDAGDNDLDARRSEVGNPRTRLRETSLHTGQVFVRLRRRPQDIDDREPDIELLQLRRNVRGHQGRVGPQPDQSPARSRGR